MFEQLLFDDQICGGVENAHDGFDKNLIPFAAYKIRRPIDGNQSFSSKVMDSLEK